MVPAGPLAGQPPAADAARFIESDSKSMFGAPEGPGGGPGRQDSRAGRARSAVEGPLRPREPGRPAPTTLVAGPARALAVRPPGGRLGAGQAIYTPISRQCRIGIS